MATDDEISTSKAKHWTYSFLDEIGIVTLHNAPLDVKTLILQRLIRLFAYGASTLILVAYLSRLGISETRVGLFMTLTLVGDVFISFGLTLVADALGRRKILALGAILMSASGLCFAVFDNYWVLLAAAVLGVITPSGNEIGPFRAVEESTIAHLTTADQRSRIFAWYALTGGAGASLGLVTGGWLTTALIERASWKTVNAYRLIYVIYAVVGVLKLMLTLALSNKCEIEKQSSDGANGETAPLIADANGQQEGNKKKPSAFALLPTLSKKSRIVLVQLCILFAFDNFASGLAPMSWVTYYFKNRFELSEGTVGTLFFTTGIIAALSVLVAASLARRIGNVRTMVFTHLPSSICLALIGIPNTFWLAALLVVLRSCTQSMDAAPRSAFLSAIVLPNERTATMGIVNIVKTISQSAGPLVTGALFGRGQYWIAFLAAGSLKVMYDLGMLALFASHRSREERASDESTDRA